MDIQPFEEQPPRMTGWLAALRLNANIDDNPMSKEPVEGTGYDTPGHPWSEWRNGFLDCRILLHKQHSQNIALGRGLVLLYKTCREEAIEAVIEMGRRNGELLCLAILAAMLECHGFDFEGDSPRMVLAIYSAMKDQMSNKPPSCREPELQAAYEQVHHIASALKTMFKVVDRATVQLNVPALRHLLEAIGDMQTAEAEKIQQGHHHWQ